MPFSLPLPYFPPLAATILFAAVLSCTPVRARPLNRELAVRGYAQVNLEQNSPEQDLASRGYAWVALDPATTKYAITGPGLSYHEDRTMGGRAFNERNQGIGLEQRGSLAAHPDWERSMSLSLVVDSFHKPAVFATYGLSHRLFETQDLEVRAGARVLGAYKYLNWQGPRSLIATVGPTLSLRHKPTGITLNGLYALNINLETHKLRNIYMLQTSLDF